MKGLRDLPVPTTAPVPESVDELLFPVARKAGPSDRGAETDLRAVAPEPDWARVAPRGLYARLGKRLFDLALVALLAPLALVPCLVVALANLWAYRDPRKIFFTQERVGLRSEPFVIYKFRTMKDVRESAVESWAGGEEHLRVTRLGKLLRNMHLDELPQLWNVLRGDMQVIGPRPEMIEVEAWARARVEGFGERRAVRPGITGLAQITQGYAGADVAAYERKLAIDRFYLENLSFRLDLAIAWRTGLWLLRGRGWSWAEGEPRPREAAARS